MAIARRYVVEGKEIFADLDDTDEENLVKIGDAVSEEEAQAIAKQLSETLDPPAKVTLRTTD